MPPRRQFLFMEGDILSHSTTGEVGPFLSEYLDEYWRSYRPSWVYNDKNKKASKKQGGSSLSTTTCPPPSLGSNIDESIFIRYEEESEDDSQWGDGEATTNASASRMEQCSPSSRSTTYFNHCSTSSGTSSGTPSFDLSPSTSVHPYTNSFASQRSFSGEEMTSQCSDVMRHSRAVYRRPALISGHIVTLPQEWMLTQVARASKRIDKVVEESVWGQTTATSLISLSCPGCSSICGYWKRDGLTLLGDFNRCDVFAVQESIVCMKRRLKHRR